MYAPGDRRSVFSVGALTFGILICRDSSYAEPARTMTTRGATVLFVPSNNGLPPQKTGRELVVDTRQADVTRAVENGMYVVRADVAGNARGLVACGTSEIVDPSGRVLRCARQFSPGLIVADIHHAGALLAASIDAST